MGWNPIKSIGDAFSGIGKALTSIGSALVKGAQALVGGVMQVFTFATSLLSFRMFAPQTPGYDASGGAASNARIQAQPNTTTPIPIVYGSAFLGGKFVDAALTTDGQVMFYVLAISGISDNGTINYDKTKMYYGDRLIAFDNVPSGPGYDPARVISLTDNAGNVDTKIQNKLYISLFTSDKNGNITNHTNFGQQPWGAGGAVMGPDSGLSTALQWSSTNRKMYSTAFAIVRLVYSSDAGTTQLSPITFNLQQLLYDVGATLPGTIWYDFMINKIYGAAVDPAYVDYDSALALNAYAYELITFKDYNGVNQTAPRYLVNGVLNTGFNVLQNIDQILTACDSWMQYNAVSGKWAVVINKAEIPSMHFDDDNIISDITLGAVDITQSPNQIEAKFPDATNRDQYNYVNESVPSYLLYPNEPVNKTSVTYELVNSSVQALYLANRFLEQNREDLLVTIGTNYQGIQVNAGDVVTVSNAAYGWDYKKFRAISVREDVASDMTLGAQIQLIEYNDAVYDNFDITQYTPAGNSDNPSADYFSGLSAPAVVDSFPYDATPTFDINVAIPLKGRVTGIILFYTTVATPTAADWQVLGTQQLSNSVPYANGSTITFNDFNLGPANYYFAFKATNDVSQSVLSPASTVFNWAPDPANATTFITTFSPATLQVPYNGVTPSLTGITFRLYGSNGLGVVDYVTATTDAASSFIAGTWRIGGSSTTGYADIVQTGVTFPTPPTDGGSYAQFGTATAMTASPATVSIPVRYKDLAGVVHQMPLSTIQVVYAQQGNTGNKTATSTLYQWNTTTPGNPSGTSIFSWSTGTNSSYTGGNGWLTSPGSNPGTPLIKLWTANKFVSDAFSATTTSVSWTSGFSIVDTSQNGATGASGIQTASAIVYQWALTIPAAPTGTSTYTWATSSFTAPSGWSLSKSTSPSAGYTLWQALVSLTDSVTATTTTINWTTSKITAAGYVGAAGVSTVSAFAASSITLSATPSIVTTSGASSLPPTNSWGGSETWTLAVPTTSAGQTVWQSDGIYNPTTGNIVWNVPFVASVKFGSLSAISANLGQVTAGSITGLTITGGTFQTNTAGFKTTITAATNSLNVYDSLGANTIVVGGSNPGGITVDTRTNGTSYPAIQAYQSTTGVGFAIPAIQAVNLGDCYYGYSSSNGTAVYGLAHNSGGQNHGIRGGNEGTGGTQTSGLVGVANGYDFYADGAGTNYGPFTGAHDVLVPVGTTITVGNIVCDVKLIIAKNITNTIFEVAQSTSANQVPIGVMVTNNGLLANSKPAAFIEKYEYVEVDGRLVSTAIMYPEYDANKDLYDYCGANAVGEGQVYVCGESGNIAVGDLIVTSSIPGVGMKQSDNIVRNITVGKARQAVTFTNSDPILVPCIYLCG